MQLCHRALTETRGAANHIGPHQPSTRTCSVGSAVGKRHGQNLIAKRPGGAEVRSSVRLAGGIIGFRIPDGTAPQEGFD